MNSFQLNAFYQFDNHMFSLMVENVKICGKELKTICLQSIYALMCPVARSAAEVGDYKSNIGQASKFG